MLVTQVTDEGQPCFVVGTTSARYYYQGQAGGFSSICDREGTDWIGFHQGPGDVPGGAANAFRGLPNLVHPDGIGHPGFTGCESTCKIEGDTIALETRSNDRRWEWSVRFTNDFAKLSIRRAPADLPYWFLYEGTIGGTYDPLNSFWGVPDRLIKSSTMSESRLTTACPFAGEKWVYFGHRDSDRVFYCARLGSGRENSVLYFMGSDQAGLDAEDGMVVFGFGRDVNVKKLLTGNEEFAFGFVESTDHQQISDQIAAHLDGALRL